MTTYTAVFTYPVVDELLPEEIERAFMNRITPPPVWAKCGPLLLVNSQFVVMSMTFYANDGETVFSREICEVDPKRPCYMRPPFTDDDREFIFDQCADEMADMSTKERGEARMTDLDDDLSEAIGYACEHIDELGPMLRAIHTKDETFKMEDEQVKEYCAAFAFRFELVDVQGLKLTPLGEDVMNAWN